MNGLSSPDMKAFNEAALGLHTTQTAEEFPKRIYQAMRTMMSGDLVVVDWVNPRTSVSLACQYFPERAIPPELNALVHVLLPLQTPIWLQCFEDPHSISDFITRNQWSKRDIFWALHEAAQEECLCLDIQLTPTLVLMIVDVRGRYGSHTSSDRLKLKLLGPHVRQVYRRLVTQGNLMGGAPVLRQAQVDVDATGQHCHWSKEARELLAAQGILVLDDELPSAVKLWFLAQRVALERPPEVTSGIQPLRLTRNSRTLTLFLMRKPERDAYWLILREKETPSKTTTIFPGLRTSRRESEVLFWVARGKSNAEIGTILGVSIGTIGRHLENIFFKLGVENRYAAGVMATRILSAKALGTVPCPG